MAAYSQKEIEKKVSNEKEKEKKMRKVFSFDAETNGLWGEAFSIGAVLLDETGNEISRFVGRCPISEKINDFVAANVLPEMESIPENYADYSSMLSAFMDYYRSNKSGADVIVHMGLPVEARLFLDAHNMGIIGDWDAPYPLIDISAYPQVGDSVDNYNVEHGITVPSFDGGTHNPLYDSMAAALCYRNIIK